GGASLDGGVSTITVVALTMATARLPGSSFSSWAASVLISDTIVCGPHCISTRVITLSLSTSVTSPTKRLRAELPRPSGFGGGGGALVRQNSASTCPAITLRPDWSWSAGKVPLSIQRRTVSSL